MRSALIRAAKRAFWRCKKLRCQASMAAREAGISGICVR
jgi:hypothetical protein